MEKIEYLGGWEANFDDKREFTSFLVTHGVDNKSFRFFRDAQSALELRINGNNIVKIFEHDACGKVLKAENIDLPVFEWEEHSVFFLEKNKKGNHVLGGKKPLELELPDDKNLCTPFQYLGTIDGTDPFFNWIGMPKLHIIYPIYECNSGVYLDYTDPIRPKILNSQTFSNDWYEPEMGEVTRIEFNETKYKVSNKLQIEKFCDSDELLLCGVPLWYQAPEIPICPKANKVMKFICTINSDASIDVIDKLKSRGLPFSDEYLCFGDHGHLFLFINPETKILHANWQW